MDKLIDWHDKQRQDFIFFLVQGETRARITKSLLQTTNTRRQNVVALQTNQDEEGISCFDSENSYAN